MPAHVAWTQNQWLPAEQATIALDDLGFLQGVVIVDRLRTCNGRPLDVVPHVRRLIESCSAVGIRLPVTLDIEEIINECAIRNRDAFAGRDFSIVSLVTPGRAGKALAGPTVIVHALPIDWRRLAEWYRSGQTLHVADNRNVPAACWSPTIKTRARLQYFLAERQAALSANSREQNHDGVVLLDIAGNITDTSMANLLMVENGRTLISPPLDSVLNGISLLRTLRLAEHSGWQVKYERLEVSRFAAADELLLCGSTGCLWPARSLGTTVFEQPTSGSAFRALSQLWIEEIGLDYMRQAADYAALDL